MSISRPIRQAGTPEAFLTIARPEYDISHGPGAIPSQAKRGKTDSLMLKNESLALRRSALKSGIGAVMWWKSIAGKLIPSRLMVIPETEDDSQLSNARTLNMAVIFMRKSHSSVAGL